MYQPVATSSHHINPYLHYYYLPAGDPDWVKYCMGRPGILYPGCYLTVLYLIMACLGSKSHIGNESHQQLSMFTAVRYVSHQRGVIVYKRHLGDAVLIQFVLLSKQDH